MLRSRSHNLTCIVGKGILSKSLFSSVKSSKKNHQCVIVGSGWAGYKFFMEYKKFLRNFDSKEGPPPIDIVVVSERNYFLYTPLLASTTVGTLEFRSIIEPVRSSLSFRNEKHFHVASVQRVDEKKKILKCKSQLNGRDYSLSYDTLILAQGSIPNTFGIPGVDKYAYFLKDIQHAKELRKKILANIELATQPGISEEEKQQLLRFVVIGGGPTGVEFCGELCDFFKQDIAKLYPQTKPFLVVHLVDSNEILGTFDKKLREFAYNKLKNHPHMQMIKQNCKEITQDKVILSDGTVLSCGLIVWTAGVGPSSITKSLNCLKSKTGNIQTNEFCQVKGFPETEDKSFPLPLKSRVFAIGDCCEIEGYRLPATAQVAESQALYLGNYEGLLDSDKYHTKWKGWHGWFIWRSAYLTKLGSWRLRLQVPIDWLKTLIVGRDVSRF